jgi:hypothetical protein
LLTTLIKHKAGAGRSKPPHYTKDSNAILFAQMFNNYVKLEGMDNERAALAFTNAIDDEVALLGVSRLPTEIQTDYEKLSAKFLRPNDGNTGMFYRSTLSQALKQKEHESVGAYYRRFVSNVDPERTEVDLVAEFCRGLQSKYKIYMNSHPDPPLEISDALRLAKKFEDLLAEQEGAVEMRPRRERIEAISQEDAPSDTLIKTLQILGDTNKAMKTNIVSGMETGEEN